MAKRNTLKQEYYKLDLGWWKDKEGKPTIEYTNWLEDRLVKNLTNRRELLKPSSPNKCNMCGVLIDPRLTCCADCGF